MPDDRISISSGYGGTSRKPYVQLVWGAQVAQLSPDETRAHALRLLEVAEAAEQDAFLGSQASSLDLPLGCKTRAAVERERSVPEERTDERVVRLQGVQRSDPRRREDV